METPPPVNLNALKGILANAKKVMAKVEEDKPIVQKSVQRGLTEAVAPTQPIYDERDEREPDYNQYQPTPKQDFQPKGYTVEQVMASNLPPAIKEAMIKNPIPQLQMPPSKFTLEDLGDLVEKKPAAKAPIRESAQSSTRGDMITISRGEIQNMINEAVANHFKKQYDKSLTEDAIKKTINLLIKEGKLAVKKK